MQIASTFNLCIFSTAVAAKKQKNATTPSGEYERANRSAGIQQMVPVYDALTSPEYEEVNRATAATASNAAGLACNKRDRNSSQPGDDDEMGLEQENISSLPQNVEVKYENIKSRQFSTAITTKKQRISTTPSGEYEQINRSTGIQQIVYDTLISPEYEEVNGITAATASDVAGLACNKRDRNSSQPGYDY